MVAAAGMGLRPPLPRVAAGLAVGQRPFDLAPGNPRVVEAHGGYSTNACSLPHVATKKIRRRIPARAPARRAPDEVVPAAGGPRPLGAGPPRPRRAAGPPRRVPRRATPPPGRPPAPPYPSG